MDVQAGDLAGALLLQAALEEISEQAVVSVSRVSAFQAVREDTALFQVGQDPPPSCDAGQPLGELGCDLGEDRGEGRKSRVRSGLLVEHLLGEEVEEVAIVLAVIDSMNVRRSSGVFRSRSDTSTSWRLAAHPSVRRSSSSELQSDRGDRGRCPGTVRRSPHP